MNSAFLRAKSSHGAEFTKPMQNYSHAAKMQENWNDNKSRDQNQLRSCTMAASTNPGVYGSVMAWLKSTFTCAVDDIKNVCLITSLRVWHASTIEALPSGPVRARPGGAPQPFGSVWASARWAALPTSHTEATVATSPIRRRAQVPGSAAPVSTS